MEKSSGLIHLQCCAWVKITSQPADHYFDVHALALLVPHEQSHPTNLSGMAC